MSLEARITILGRNNSRISDHTSYKSTNCKCNNSYNCKISGNYKSNCKSNDSSKNNDNNSEKNMNSNDNININCTKHFFPTPPVWPGKPA